MNLSDQTPKSPDHHPAHRSPTTQNDFSVENMDTEDCIDALIESSKVYRNTGKILSKFLAKRDRVRTLLGVFDDALKEELSYIANLLHKFNKNFSFERFKEEAVNNLYIYKENLKLAMNLLLDEKFEHINNQISTEKYPLSALYAKRDAKTNTQALKSSIMECIKEENEDVLDNNSCNERKSLSKIDALDTIKRSHIDITNYLTEMDRTMANRETKSPRTDLQKSKDMTVHAKDLKRLNKSSERLTRKEASVPKSRQIRNSKNVIMSVQYFTNSVKQRFKMTAKPTKKEPGSAVLRPHTHQ